MLAFFYLVFLKNRIEDRGTRICTLASTNRDYLGRERKSTLLSVTAAVTYRTSIASFDDFVRWCIE